jgi:TetR/AcrR family transcriptional regulator, tetracycline repressor protein
VVRQERERLDRGKIVRAALHLLDEVGLDGLTTRTLADWLGVRSPALYWHFKNKRELVDAVAELMIQQTSWPDPPRPGDDVTVWLAGRGHAFRRALLAHRDGARVHAGTRPSAGQLSSVNAQIAALTSVGFDPTDAARAALAVSRYTIGWVLEEQAASSRTEAAEGGPDLSDFPELQAARDVLEQRNPDADFDFGLRALIAGLAVAARP